MEELLHSTAAHNRAGPLEKAFAGMRYLLVGVRVLSLLGLALWVGGFTFYSAVVIPALHDAIGSVEGGFVTQNVTNSLNTIGVTVLTICSLATALQPPSARGRARTLRMVLLVISAVLLGLLIVWHRRMDQHLDSTGLRGFYSLHRLYLIASTAQWLANIALLICFAWERPGSGGMRVTTD